MYMYVIKHRLNIRRMYVNNAIHNVFPHLPYCLESAVHDHFHPLLDETILTQELSLSLSLFPHWSLSYTNSRLIFVVIYNN